MGLELYGLHVYGPSSLDHSAGQAGVGVIKERQLTLATAIKDTTITAGQLMDLLYKLFPAACDRSLYHEYEEQDLETLTDMAVRLSSLDADKVLSDLRILWDSAFEFRDCSFRIIGEQRVVFCGDSTWGDPPIGQGYSTLIDAEALGLFEFLGIQ